MSKINKTECWVAFGLCLFLVFVMKLSYSSHLSDEKIKHSSDVSYMPVVGTMHTYQKYEEIDYTESSDGTYTKNSTTKYNITYSYKVNNVTYYKTINDKTSLDTTISFYYNPDNPQQTSFFATYEDAVEGFKVVKIIGDGFVVLSILVGFFAVYRTFIYKAPEALGGIVVRDDMDSFIDKDDLDEEFDQVKMFENYGVVTTENFDYISNVNVPSMVVPEQGNKKTVDKIETIPFPGSKTSKEPVVLYTEEEYNNINKEN